MDEDNDDDTICRDAIEPFFDWRWLEEVFKAFHSSNLGKDFLPFLSEVNMRYHVVLQQDLPLCIHIHS
jgi:hypothetical protein